MIIATAEAMASVQFYTWLLGLGDYRCSFGLKWNCQGNKGKTLFHYNNYIYTKKMDCQVT